MVEYLVTGGAGYVGEVLARQLLRAGKTVRIFDLNRPTVSDPNLDFQLGDICDVAAVRRACDGVRVVHHNVAHLPIASRDNSAFWRVNRDGTQVLLEAACTAGVEKVVYTSTTAVYGVPESTPVNESMSPNPGEVYGEAKLAGERLCADYARSGLDVSIVRCCTVLGNGRLGIFQILFEWIRNGYNIPVFGRGDNIYHFIQIDDATEALVAAGEQKGSGTYNIGAERINSMRETLEGVIRHAGTTSRVRSVPIRPAIFLMRCAQAFGLSPLGTYHAIMYGSDMYLDISKAKRELGWQPRYGHMDMFCEGYDSYCSNRAEILRNASGQSIHRSPIREGALALMRFLP